MFNLLSLQPAERVYWIRHAERVFRTRSPVELNLGYRPLRVTLAPDLDHYVLRVLLGADTYDEFVEAGGPIGEHDAMRLFREWAEHHGVTVPEFTAPAQHAAEPAREYRRGRPVIR